MMLLMMSKCEMGETGWCLGTSEQSGLESEGVQLTGRGGRT